MSEYIEFLEGKKHPKKNADRANTPNGFKDAGYIIKEHEVIVDIDVLSIPTIEKLIAHFGIKTQTVWTESGCHFYFKKPDGFSGNKTICPLGFEIEYKHSKNTPNGITIKRNGKMRKIEHEGIREELPDIFRKKNKLKSLIGLDDGEGRNSDLFAHRMRIQDLPRWKSMLRFINNNIFATPMEEQEFLVLSRDGVKPKAEKDNQPEIAKYLIDKYKIVQYLGRFYWFINGEYLSNEEELNRLIAIEVPELKTYMYKEIKAQMEFLAPLIPSDKVFDIKLQNGILRKGKFREIDYTDFTPYSISIPYIKDAAPVQVVDDYLNHLSNGDESYRMRILEVMAHCLIVDPEFKRMLSKFFIFIGGGGNGKGTFLKILMLILGRKNCSALSIQQMQDERYLFNMIGKLANLGDDLEEEYITKEQIKILKNISTCDFISVRRLFEMSRDVIITASLVFTSNHMLKAREKGDSYKRRVDWMPIFNKPSAKIPDFVEQITTPAALQYWMRLIVDAYKRVYVQKGMTPCSIVENYNRDYHQFNDNIVQFLDENPMREDWKGKGKLESYREYKQWCDDNDEPIQGKERLHQSIMQRFDFDYGQVKIREKGKETTSMRYKDR